MLFTFKMTKFKALEYINIQSIVFVQTIRIYNNAKILDSFVTCYITVNYCFAGSNKLTVTAAKF